MFIECSVRKGHAAAVRMTGSEARHLFGVLFGKNGTRQVKHFPAHSQNLPECVDDLRLNRCETRNILRAP